ncbi:type III pantothenate kinase [Adhaeretor mobilis]|uniref:Type III pantothenate kinase n=1 Tax=Adhaeretor mobilis TaxID=1930276 RepID=A0A517N2U0_9BACT|nr:type III pantothenate kinase [Adhaeretor mobilis]QDT01455.1 Type III pantothenate kinase [Adhaeretor mobilis]
MLDLLAIDVGNSRVKLGLFRAAAACEDKPQTMLPIAPPPLAVPDEVASVVHRDRSVREWLAEVRAFVDKVQCESVEGTTLACSVASVHPSVLGDLQLGLKRSGIGPLEVLTQKSLSLQANINEPEKVGIDRLLAVVAANRLRRAHEAAIVVDAGSAITVDLLDTEGVFQGGAILPGMQLASQALQQGTAALPQIAIDSKQEAPAAIGRTTQEAIGSGIYWGTIGAVRELTNQLSRTLAASPQTTPPLVILTGGDAPLLAKHLEIEKRQLRSEPALVLSGIWTASSKASSKARSL